MRELGYIEVKIEPSYRATERGIEDRQISVTVRFKGKEYHDTEVMWNSDAISVVDYCFDRARRAIKDMLDREESKP